MASATATAKPERGREAQRAARPRAALAAGLAPRPADHRPEPAGPGDPDRRRPGAQRAAPGPGQRPHRQPDHPGRADRQRHRPGRHGRRAGAGDGRRPRQRRRCRLLANPKTQRARLFDAAGPADRRQRRWWPTGWSSRPCRRPASRGDEAMSLRLEPPIPRRRAPQRGRAPPWRPRSARRCAASTVARPAPRRERRPGGLGLDPDPARPGGAGRADPGGQRRGRRSSPRERLALIPFILIAIAVTPGLVPAADPADRPAGAAPGAGRRPGAPGAARGPSPCPTWPSATTSSAT